MGVYIAPSDLTESLPGVTEKRIGEVIADAEAWAAIHAPGIKAESFKADVEKMAAVKAILRKAIVYDLRSGSGTTSQQSVGVFSHTVRENGSSSTLFSAQQIAALKSLTAVTVGLSGAYSVPLSTTPLPLL